MQIRKLSFTPSLLQEALEYWRKTIVFQVVFSLFYFGLFFILMMFVFNYYGITEQINELKPYINGDISELESRYIEIIQTQNFRSASLWMVVVTSLLWPLNLGLLKIYEKIDRNESIFLQDLFVGYEGKDFFKFLGFAFLWNAIYFLSKSLIFLAPVWVFLTLFSGPLLFLGKQNLGNAVRLSVQAVGTNIGLSLGFLFIGFLMSYSGILLCFVGILFTFSFWNALLYVGYKNIFVEDKDLNLKN